MAEIAIILDILRKNHSPSTAKALHSSGYFSAKAATFLLPPELLMLITNYWDGLNNYNTKQYKVELKPLFSAFEWRALAVIIFKSFVSFFVLHPPEPCSSSKDDNDDLPLDNEKEEQHVADYVVLLKKAAKQILRDMSFPACIVHSYFHDQYILLLKINSVLCIPCQTTVVTTRRILERISVHYVSRRMACKLLKDVPKSAMRKSGRRLPTAVFLFSVSVSRATFRGQGLGLAATWLIEVGIEINRFISRIIRSREEDDDDIDLGEQLKLLGKKVSDTSIRCGASLAFGSIGAGIGAILIRPSMGQHIGCVAGESAGPAIVPYCLGKFSHAEP